MSENISFFLPHVYNAVILPSHIVKLKLYGLLDLLHLFQQRTAELVLRYFQQFLLVAGTWPTFSPNLSEEQAEQIIVLAVESGINVFDLSEAHSGMYSKYTPFL